VVQAPKNPPVADSIVAKHAAPKARRRPAATRARVLVAYAEADAPSATSAPDTMAGRVPDAPETASTVDVVAVEQPVGKTRHRPTADRPRVVTACHVADLPKTSDASVAKQSAPRAKRRPAVTQQRDVIAHAVPHVSETLSAADATKHPVVKTRHRPVADRPRVVTARRVTHLPETPSSTDQIGGKHPTPGAPPAPAAERPRVAVAYRVRPAPQSSSATHPTGVCKTCGSAPLQGLHQPVTLPDRWMADASSAAEDGGSADFSGHTSGGPSANVDVAYVAADRSPQQMMMPPQAPESQPTALRSFHYVPGHKAVEDVPRPPAQQKLIQLNQDGNYVALAKQGAALLKKEKVDDQLKFIIANAMAWTGKLHPAETLYKTLLNGPMALDTKVALANIMRWRGKNYLAVPMYREVLAVDPTHEEATHGLKLSEDAMRPRTRLTMNKTHDSDQVNTNLVTLNHQWQTHDGLRTWGVELNRMSDSSPYANARQATVVLRHQALDKPMEPAVEIGLGDRLYGSITIRPTSLPVHVTVGKVNWGQMSLNPLALGQRLSALNLGASANFAGRFGSVSLTADTYHVSDSNNVQTGTVRFSPAVRLPLHLRPVVGLEYRKAGFNTTRYWSPAVGYGLGYVGLEGDWSSKNDRWTVSASVQRGWGFYGEARPSWGGSLSGRYAISHHWSIGANLWSITNSRNDKPYKARSGIIFIERSW
jgi:hypothetical protein